MVRELSLTFHSDAADLQYVYKWRLEQEVALRASKGAGMTDEQVKNFVDGCMSLLLSPHSPDPCFVFPWGSLLTTVDNVRLSFL